MQHKMKKELKAKEPVEENESEEENEWNTEEPSFMETWKNVFKVLQSFAFRMSIKIRPGSAGAPVKIDYEFPTWCGKPPPGTHLDVMKDDKLIEKLLIDEKKYYIFGRNNEMCDFVTR